MFLVSSLRTPHLLPGPEDLLQFFFNESFIVLHLTFKAMIRFELTFAYGVRFNSRLIFWPMDVQLLQHRFLRRLFLFHWIAFAPKKSVRYVSVSLFLGSLFSIDLCVYASPHCLVCYGDIVSPNIRKCDSCHFFFFKTVLAILGPFLFHIHFRISLSMSKKKNISGILIGIVLKLGEINLGNIDIFTMLNCFSF